MECRLQYKESEKNIKSLFVEKGAMDQYNKVLDTGLFNRLNSQARQSAFSAYGLKLGHPFLLDGSRALANKQFHTEIDNARKFLGLYDEKIAGKAFPRREEGRISVEEEDQTLEDTLLAFVKEINPDFKIEILDDLKTVTGRSADAIAKIKDFTIQLRNGKESELPEEVCHFFVELLDKESDLYKNLMDSITGTRLYKQVVKEYTDEYGRDYERLKREAVAKMVSIYLTNKESFKYWSGNDSLISKLIDLFRSFIGFSVEKVSPFIRASEMIINADRSLLTEDPTEVEDMYSLTPNLQTLSGVDTSKYDTVLVNLNDTLIDYKGFPGTKDDKRKMIFGPNVDEYYRKVKFTKLGRELKDRKKNGINNSNLVVFTDMQITPYLAQRLEEELGITKLIKTSESVFYQNEDGQTIQVPNPKLGDIAKTYTGNLLVIDNKKKDPSIKDLDNVQFRQYLDRYAKYENPIDKIIDDRFESRRKSLNQKMRDQIRGLVGEKSLLEKVIEASKIIRKQFDISEYMDKLAEETGLGSSFKTEEGMLGLPVTKMNRVSAMIQEGNKILDAIIEYVASMEITTAFFKGKNGEGYTLIKEAIESGDKDRINWAMKEASTLLKMADTWLSYTSKTLSLISENDKAESVREALNRLRSEAERTKSILLPLSRQIIEKELSPMFEVYNQNKEDLIKDKENLKKKYLDKGDEKGAAILQGQIDSIKAEMLNPQAVLDALQGKGPQFNSITVWVKELHNSQDVLISGVASLIKSKELEADTKSIQEAQQFGQAVDDIMKRYNLNQTDVESILTKEMVQVWNPEKEMMEYKPALALLNRWQNRHEYYEERQKMLDAYNKYSEDRSEENKKLYLDAKNEFNSWRQTNWHSDYTTEFYKRYEPLMQDKDLYEEANTRQSEAWENVFQIKQELEYATDEKQIEDIERRLQDAIRVAKNLRSLYDMDGNPKTDVDPITGETTNDLKVATLLRAKLDIDKNVYEIKHDTGKFRSAMKQLISSFDTVQLSDEVREQLLTLLDTDLKKLGAYIEESGGMVPDRIRKWFDNNTITKFSDEFYDNRNKIIEGLSKDIERLNALYGIKSNEDLTEIWQKMFAETSFLRDEDGVFDGSISSPALQQVVKQYEQEIERIKDMTKGLKSNVELTVEEELDAKDIKVRISKHIEDLTKIQSKTFTLSYLETFIEKYYASGFNEHLKDVDLFMGSDIFSLINNDRFKNAIFRNKDNEFAKWFIDNHFSKAIKIDNGMFYEDGVAFYPTYIWRKITPQDNSMILTVPSYSYISREVREKTKDTGVQLKTKKIDWVTWNPITKTWLPKSDRYLNPVYTQLFARSDLKSQGLQKLLIEFSKYHLNNQKENVRDARLEFVLPYVQRQLMEGNVAKNMYNRFLYKYNAKELGEANMDSPDPENNIKNRIKNWFKGGMNVRTPSKSTRIMVPYTSHIDPEEVSKDIPLTLTLFGGSALRSREFKQLSSLTYLVKENLSNTNIGNSPGESANRESNQNRLDAIEFIEDTNLFGNVKMYELGKAVDDFALKIRSLNTFGSQSDITGVFNHIKNNLQGRFQNLINAEFADWSSTKSMRKAASRMSKMLPKFLYETNKPLDQRSKDYGIMTFFLPALSSDFKEMLLSGSDKRFYKNHVGYYLAKLSEFNIASTLLYGHLHHVKVEKDGVTKELYDILQYKDGKLTLDEGWTTKGRKVDMDYLQRTLLTFMSVQTYVQGKAFSKTKMGTSTIGNSLLYFKNWLIPMLRRRFDKSRANYIVGEDVEGYWLTFGNLTFKMMRNYFREGALYWDTFSPQEKQNYIIAAKEIAFMMGSLLFISLVFGFDADDPDKFKKLKDNSYLENVALQIALQAKNETESLSAMPFFNIEKGFVPPVLTEGYKFIEKPFTGISIITQSFKIMNATFDLAIGSENAYYKQNIPTYNIEKGDSKAKHYVEKFLQIDDLIYLSNPEGKIQSLITMMKR